MFLLKIFLCVAMMNSTSSDCYANIFKKIRSKFTEQKKPVEQKTPPDTKNSAKDIYQWFKTYSEVISIVEQKAFRSVDFAKFIQESLKSAVGDIDAHSNFLDLQSYSSAIESTSGEFSGIGVSIFKKSINDEALLIINVLPGGPAQKAGLHSGDRIVEADGHKFKNLSDTDAIAKLKGPPGSTFSVKVLRDKKPLEFKITRDVIKDQSSQCYLFKKHDIYYLSLKMFTETLAQQATELIKIANQGKCNGLILDLRRNPGGILQSAIEMSGLFVEKDSMIASTKDKNNKTLDRYYTTTNPILKTDIPIFILIDNFTASAAEILAGALRYHSMQSYLKKSKKNNLLVVLVGTSTFGKGSVQEVIPISNGCALKLTTMLYYLPDDLSIQAKGIEPDFIINPKFVPNEEIKWVSEMFGKEASLKRHITVAEASGKKDMQDDIGKDAKTDDTSMEMELSGEQPSTPIKTEEKEDMSPEKWEERQQEELGRDVQVQAAVNMINLLHIAKRCDQKLVATRQQVVEYLKQHYLTDDKVEIVKLR